MSKQTLGKKSAAKTAQEKVESPIPASVAAITQQQKKYMTETETETDSAQSETGVESAVSEYSC
jgi:hypothetical protein